MAGDIAVSVSFFHLSEALRPYFTALYLFDIQGDGQLMTDALHPEWAALRFTKGIPPLACIGPGELGQMPPFVLSGPTSKSIRFGVTTAQIWGLGLQPAGWAKFVDGQACDFADRIVNGSYDPAFTVFAPILDIVRESGEIDGVAGRIDQYLMAHLSRPSPQEAQIIDYHQALLDPDTENVKELAQRARLSRRSLERLSARYFGFAPKVMLRRMRFLRSLARFMLEPGLNWIEAIDAQYYDQAQFVRDFRAFMNTTPSEYAMIPHPIIEKMMRQRMLDQGAVPQTDLPTIFRYARPPEVQPPAE